MSNYIGDATFTGGSSSSGVTVTASSTPPPSPKLGDIWWDTDDDRRYTRLTPDGVSQIWIELGGGGSSATGITQTSAAVAPASPALGDEWYNTTSGILYKRINDGVSALWLDISTSGGGGSASAFTASATAPITPALGDHWYDTTDGRIYIRATDGTSALWIDISS